MSVRIYPVAIDGQIVRDDLSVNKTARMTARLQVLAHRNVQADW
jgi:hypothetical protein